MSSKRSKPPPDRIVAAQVSGTAWRVTELPEPEAVAELVRKASHHSEPLRALGGAVSYYRHRIASGNIWVERAETAIRLLALASTRFSDE